MFMLQQYMGLIVGILVAIAPIIIIIQLGTISSHLSEIKRRLPPPPGPPRP
jgi:hypothetical protein